MAYLGKKMWTLNGVATRRDFWSVAIKSYCLKLLIALPIILIPFIRRCSLQVPFSELDGTDRMALLLGVSLYVVGEVMLFSVSVRRLHDMGLSGRWIATQYVMMAIPFVGQSMPLVTLLILGCSPSRINNAHAVRS